MIFVHSSRKNFSWPATKGPWESTIFRISISYLTCGGVIPGLPWDEFLASQSVSSDRCSALLKKLATYYGRCHQGGFASDRYGVLVFSWVRRVDNEKHNLSYVKPSFPPSLFAFADSSISFPTSSPNSSLDMGVDKLHKALDWALRGSVPKNGPIDFASKNHFSLNSADGKGLVPKY